LEEFEVEFGRKAGLARRPADALGLIGKGSLRFEGDAIIARGSKGSFGRSKEHRIGRGHVVNVVRLDERTIRFDVVTGEPANVQFEARDAASADAIVALLPEVLTAEFVQRSAEHAQFQAALDALGTRTPVTITLVAANLAIFAAMCIAGVGIFEPDGRAVIAWGSNFGPLTMHGEWWRLFTATFLHFGFVHASLNMWALYESGRMVERLYGSARFLSLYVFAGLAGSMASLLWNPHVNSAGASGAIFGVFGGMLAFVVLPRNGVPAWIMAEHRNSTLLFAGYSLAYGFVHAGIDNAAHIGGLAGGFVIGLLLARPVDVAVRRQRSPSRLVLAAACATVILAAMWWPLGHPSAQLQREQRWQQVMLGLEQEEGAAIVATQRLMDLGKSNEISAAVYGRRMKDEVLPLWRKTYRDIAAVPLAPGDADYALQQGLLGYFGARIDALSLFGDAVARNDAALAQKAAAAGSAADQALEKLKTLGAKKN
jgi:rhomboid protease GluP